LPIRVAPRSGIIGPALARRSSSCFLRPPAGAGIAEGTTSRRSAERRGRGGDRPPARASRPVAFGRGPHDGSAL